MLTFTIRRLLISVPTLIFISLIIFLLLNLAPNDPMAQVPLTVPPEVKEKMREALGLGQPLYIQFWKWLVQFFWIEPQVLIDHIFGTSFSEGDLRVISWQTRSPVMDMIVQRLPQTLWVVGMSYVVGILIALPIGNLLRLSSLFCVRPGRHLCHHDRLFDPALFHRAACDRDFRGAARLAALNL